MTDAATEPPFLRVRRGCPDDAEVAAVTVALIELARMAGRAPSRRPRAGAEPASWCSTGYAAPHAWITT